MEFGLVFEILLKVRGLTRRSRDKKQYSSAVFKAIGAAGNTVPSTPLTCQVPFQGFQFSIVTFS